MLAEKVERAGGGAGTDVRGVVQELSKRLSDLREAAPAPAPLGARIALSQDAANEPPQAAPEALQSDLALVKAAIEAERRRAEQLREELKELAAQLGLLEEESRRVAQLRADREQLAARVRTFATAAL